MALLALLIAAAPEPPWEQVAHDDGVTVLTREKPGTGIQELRATGDFDAAPGAVWKALWDYPNYRKNMPSTEVSDVLATEEGGKTIYFYSVISAPFVAKRDYVLRIRDTTDPKDPAGALTVSWTVVTDKGPPAKRDMVRLKVNDGFWRLEPRDGGKRTHATYYLFTDPGGSLPKWIVNLANKSTIPEVFRCLRRAVKATG